MSGPTTVNVYTCHPAAGGGSAVDPVLNVTASSGVFTIASLVGIQRVNLTTDSTGECTLDITEYPYHGQTVEFVLASQADPGDFVTLPALAINGYVFTAQLAAENELAALLFSSEFGSDLWKPASFVTMLSSDFSDTTVNMGGSGLPYQATVVSDSSEVYVFAGSVAADTSAAMAPVTGVVLKGIGETLGQPIAMSFTLDTGTQPVSLDPSNFLTLAGGTPSDITLANGDSISLIPSDLDTWLILGASAGVVTV